MKLTKHFYASRRNGASSTGGPSILVISLWIFLIGCGLDEFAIQEKKLAPLVQRHATKAEVIEILGPKYVDYSKTGTNWHYLVSYLQRERPNEHLTLRKY